MTFSNLSSVIQQQPPSSRREMIEITNVVTQQQQPQIKNQNLANIIESFKKEKTAFNERFSELKKRLDTFNNKRGCSENGFNKTAPMGSTL